MPGEFYFMALGGLGVSLAGFAGLIAALDRRAQARSPVAVWRIRHIVVGGFIVTFAGFGTVAVYTVTREDLGLTVRLVSLLVAGAFAVHVWVGTRPGPAWPKERGRLVAMLASGALVVGLLINVVLAGLGLLQLLFLALLADPVSVFVNTVRGIARGEDRPESLASETQATPEP